MVLAVAALAVATGATAFAQGKLEVVGGDTYDWGAVAPARLKGTIEIKNVGDDTLKITNVKPSCGCTTAPIDKNVLLPGESGKINVEIDMVTRTGPQTKTITVSSSDPKNPTQIIYLKADVKRAMAYNPAEYFLINNGVVGEESVASVRLANTGEQAFTVYPPEFVQGNVRVRFELDKEKEIKPGEDLELKVFVTPLEAGSANGIIRVRTNHTAPENQAKELPIYGSVAAATTPGSAPDTKSSHK
jgi:hypothetical protein